VAAQIAQILGKFVIPIGEGIPEAFDFPGFRVALAIASLPGMTFESWRVFLGHCTGVLG
jgi:hypothetical protein